MKAIFILIVTSTAVASTFECVHCPHPMSKAVSDNILKQALQHLVPDDGPNYTLLKTIYGESTASHFYGTVYTIYANLVETNSIGEKTCSVDIVQMKVTFKCCGDVVVKTMKFGIMYPRDISEINE